MTTPHLALPRRATSGTSVRAERFPLAPRLAYPFLMVGLVAVLAGYAAVGLLLLRLVLGLF